MKPKEIAALFSEYMEEGSTPKGMKIQSFFSQLDHSQKSVVARNIARAFAAYQEEEKRITELRKKKKKEISELKKKARELGLVISEA